MWPTLLLRGGGLKSHLMISGEASDAIKELREVGQLNARAAIAQSIASTSAVVLWLTGVMFIRDDFR